jgi:hypothetical protein
MPLVAVLSYLTWRNYQQIDRLETVESTLLILEIPKANDKKELAAEQLFASLHGILRDKKELRLSGGIQEHISFEIASVNGQIRFYVWVPKTLQSFVEGQIYAQYPTVQIHQADEDYTEHERDHSVVYSEELTMTAPEFLPVRTFQSFEVDPLAGITGTLAKNDTNGKTSADVAKSAVSMLKVVLRIAKHFGTMAKRTFTHEEAHVIDNTRVELVNTKGQKITVTPEELEIYRNTPPTRLRQIVSMVSRGTTLYVDDKPIEPGTIPLSAEAVSYKERRVFDDRDEVQTERLLYPELAQDMFVTLEGELTRGNARAGTLGFSYNNHILKAIPPAGDVKAVRDTLFGLVKIEAYVDRRSTAKGSHAVLKKPILRIINIEAIESEGIEPQQKLL